MAYHPWNVGERLCFVSTIEIQSLCAIWKIREKTLWKKSRKKNTSYSGNVCAMDGNGNLARRDEIYCRRKLVVLVTINFK